jgi:DNA polymerase-3 subunit epsilon
MTWTMRRAGWDTETTGLSIDTDRIVTAAVVFTGGGQPDKTFKYLINPGMPSHPKAIETHGISDEKAATEGVDPKVALDDLAEKLAAALDWGMPLVGFNVAFDWSMLHADLTRNGLRSMAERVSRPLYGLVDSLVIDKAVDRYRSGSRRLDAVCKHYGVTLKNAHTADADAWAALRVAEQIVERYPRVAAMAPAGLFAAQQGWALEQAASLQEYRRSVKAGEQRDANAVIDGSWPLRGTS